MRAVRVPAPSTWRGYCPERQEIGPGRSKPGSFVLVRAGSPDTVKRQHNAEKSPFRDGTGSR